MIGVGPDQDIVVHYRKPDDYKLEDEDDSYIGTVRIHIPKGSNEHPTFPAHLPIERITGIYLQLKKPSTIRQLFSRLSSCSLLLFTSVSILSCYNFAEQLVEEIKRLEAPNLQKIRIEICGLRPSAIFEFSNKWSNLQQLCLSMNNIGNEGCGYLACGNYKSLKKLDLTRNRVSWLGCKQLAETDWSNLNYLKLIDNPIGAKGMKYLSRVHWQSLENLQILDCDITETAIKWFSKVAFSEYFSHNFDDKFMKSDQYGLLTTSQSPNLKKFGYLNPFDQRSIEISKKLLLMVSSEFRARYSKMKMNTGVNKLETMFSRWCFW